MIEKDAEFSLVIKSTQANGRLKFRIISYNEKVPAEIVITMLDSYLKEIKSNYLESFRAGLSS